MKIKITDSKILKLVDDTNGRKTAHTFDSDDVRSVGEWAESKLDSMELPKKHRTGVTLRIESSESVAGRYKYSRSGNVITLVRGSKDWFLTGFELTEFGTGEGGRHKFNIGSEGQNALLRKMAKKHSLELV
jgi:hypothetical protein